MGRTEYYNDPNAPKANTLIPASNLLVADDSGAILLQRRRDTGQWALPGGAQDIGETAAECAVRECLEETGIIAEITGFLGVYTNPRHIVAYTDGEIRQQYENTYIGRPVGGEPTINDEADGVRFVQPADLDAYDIHPSMRQQIGDYLAGTYPYLGRASSNAASTRPTAARIPGSARRMNRPTTLSAPYRLTISATRARAVVGLPSGVVVMSQYRSASTSNWPSSSGNSASKSSRNPRSSASIKAKEWLATSRTRRSSRPWTSRRKRAPSSGWNPVVARRGA
jgi:8-oxo-dGTP pyrophosphatase MutT (NUDIX family)